MSTRPLALLAIGAGAAALTGPAPAAGACLRGKPVVISVAAIQGEPVRAARSYVDGRLVQTLRATRITRVTLRNLRPGRRKIELRLASRNNTRTVTLRRTVVCP